MDGENNGTPYLTWHDLGVKGATPIFGHIHIHPRNLTCRYLWSTPQPVTVTNEGL